MTSISFKEYHRPWWPILGINIFCLLLIMSWDFFRFSIPFNPSFKFIVYLVYPVLIGFYLFYYWKWAQYGYSWNIGLKQWHLLGSLVTGGIFFAVTIRWLIENGNGVPRRYYVLEPKPYLYQFSYWIYKHSGEIMVIAVGLFFIAQVFFLINLILMFRKGRGSL